MSHVTGHKASVFILFLSNETFLSLEIFVKYLVYLGFWIKTDKMNKNQVEPGYKGHPIEFGVFF